MKKYLFVISFQFLFIANLFAQTSQKGFSFQGYAIDPEGKALSQDNITVKFTVYPKGGSGVTYTEELALTTDDFGVFHATVGERAPSDFQKMNFTTNGVIYWMKVEVKKTVGGAYTTISDSQMMAVPYARHADNGVPVGTLVPFAGPTTKIPEGWVICDGSALDGTDPDYVQLYSVLGNTWGGSGTNFNLPDLRGKFLRGVDAGAGKDIGASSRSAEKSGGNTGDAVGTYQGEQTKSHNHGVTDPGHNHSYNDVFYSENGGSVETGNNQGSGNSDDDNSGWGFDRTTEDKTTGVSVNSTGGNETRPVNAAVYYIIKY
jgi:microcystin-dependent protein